MRNGRIAFSAIPAAAIGLLLAGCSIHPIPDDVSYYNTEEIVLNVRCEAKATIRKHIQKALDEAGLGGGIVDPDTVLSDPANRAKLAATDKALLAKFENYGASSIAYDFSFEITENNDNSASVTFKVPYTNGSFTLATGGHANKERHGHRKFKMSETLRDLNKLRCGDGFTIPAKRPTYPLTGSIGVSRIIDTFVALTRIGYSAGTKVEKANTLVDTITFATTVSAGISPTITLNEVGNRFRLKRAEVTSAHKRVDIHQVIITIVAPPADLRGPYRITSSTARERAIFTGGGEDAALEILCIAEAEAREERFGQLRAQPPEVYCARDRDAVRSRR